jgi:hypothetical protein
MSDVNEHYFVRNEGKLRAALQEVEDFFVRQVAKFTPTAKREDSRDVQPSEEVAI